MEHAGVPISIVSKWPGATTPRSPSASTCMQAKMIWSRGHGPCRTGLARRRARLVTGEPLKVAQVLPGGDPPLQPFSAPKLPLLPPPLDGGFQPLTHRPTSPLAALTRQRTPQQDRNCPELSGFVWITWLCRSRWRGDSSRVRAYPGPLLASALARSTTVRLGWPLRAKDAAATGGRSRTGQSSVAFPVTASLIRDHRPRPLPAAAQVGRPISLSESSRDDP